MILKWFQSQSNMCLISLSTQIKGEAIPLRLGTHALLYVHVHEIKNVNKNKNKLI